MLSSNMTHTQMAHYYRSGGLLTDIMRVTGLEYQDVKTIITKQGVAIKPGGYRVRKAA